jgi:hypothetical protein
MVVTTHQPIFLPWPGFFFKAMNTDCMVLLDDVQFPRGRGWMNRNRLKSEQGELWLTVPVHKKGRGLQSIREVEVFGDSNWQRKHLRGIQQNYANAPYLDDHFPALKSIYKDNYQKLVALNVALIRYFLEALHIETELVLQSDLEVTGRATNLIIRICQRLGAQRYLTFSISAKYLDRRDFDRERIDLQLARHEAPVYPQLWGSFVGNLSVLDLLLNCGPRSKVILSSASVTQTKTSAG